jgi:DNA-binding response OmpR family regulator
MAHILIADDESGHRDPLASHLSAARHRITLASDGREALALIAENQPDAVFLDVMMPHKDGFEVLQTLRKEASTRELPVILLTARSADEEPWHDLWSPYLEVKRVNLEEAAAKLEWIFRNGRTALLVLVAEDELHLLWPIGQALRKAGLRVDLASTGEEALRRASKRPPEVVILDMMMPRMDGLDVMRRLKADPRNAAAPVILLLGKTADANVRRQWEQAGEYWLTKPVAVDELVEGVIQLLTGQEPPAAAGDPSAW